MWERHEALQQEIMTAWRNCDEKHNLHDISMALKTTMHRLRCWSYNNFGSVRKELESLRDQLGTLQQEQNENKRQEILIQ